MRVRETFFFLLAAASCAHAENESLTASSTKPAISLDWTEALRPDAIVARGVNAFDPRYDPARIGKSLSEIDTIYDYDAFRLEAVERALAHVDRRTALGAIFEEVSRGATSDTERHLAVLGFLHRATLHSSHLQPMHSDRSMVLDPLTLLWLNEMRCGHAARLAVDLFEAGGYRGRLVQLGGHVVAEIQYEGAWHYLDADGFGGGQSVQNLDGTIPSVADLSRDPARLDKLGFYSELSLDIVTGGYSTESVPYPSSLYFSARAYVGYGPQYYVKTATRAQAAGSRNYGWEHYEATSADDIELSDTPLRWQPGAVRLRTATVAEDGRTIRIDWEPAKDGDGDVVGFRVLLGSRSRGWNPESFSGATAAAGHFSGGATDRWSPSMYERMFSPIPSDLGSIFTERPTVSFSIPPGAVDVFVSIMPVDVYGQSIGREAFAASEELWFP